MTTALDRIRQLRASGAEDDALRALVELARSEPDDLAVRIEAAHACARSGTVQEAIRHYDAAWRLGIPHAELPGFLPGYSMALCKVGRADEAVALLGDMLAEHPESVPLKTFLALALHAAGHGHAALATMLDLILDLTIETGALDEHSHDLTCLRTELLERAMGARK